jgi:hypothetical protein
MRISPRVLHASGVKMAHPALLSGCTRFKRDSYACDKLRINAEGPGAIFGMDHRVKITRKA